LFLLGVGDFCAGDSLSNYSSLRSASLEWELSLTWRVVSSPTRSLGIRCRCLSLFLSPAAFCSSAQAKKIRYFGLRKRRALKIGSVAEVGLLNRVPLRWLIRARSCLFAVPNYLKVRARTAKFNQFPPARSPRSLCLKSVFGAPVRSSGCRQANALGSSREVETTAPPHFKHPLA
jgi:hypothetical protein